MENPSNYIRIEVGTLQRLNVTNKMLSYQLMFQRPKSASKRQLETGLDNVQKHRLIKATRRMRTIGSLFPLLVAAM